ncbi:MAG: hypothetical protein AN481_17670 [Aphanizomenon flos-aquae LD13]|jgi:hypothetical protein|uniref:Uncharacterized protein n=1 Tax=Aphanizomenon flos-aquae LD13 TaxID=1710894 RepID=A0A1B7VJR2_APHFL|nr:hypothetical protein [Aphanizomenon flos-aquae UKL13-PB]OBQ19471.1 MAG: hypothetical protein AN481_17670 [Aphanizomenon flos-aquae LD13]HCQ20882.1 hypothetical protein [Anabaena sp. UBA12330]
MQPLKITVQGDFWDCQIYRGRLYLWYTDGSIGVYKWDSLIEDTFKNEVDELVLQCAFVRGDYLYGNNFRLLFEDSDIKNALFSKFSQVSDKDLFISPKKLKEFELSRQDNPVIELPTDTYIYGNTLFTLTDSGIYSASVHRTGTKFGVSTRPKKLWDCPLLSIKANRNALAMAGGDEGLFELHLDDYHGDLSELEKIDSRVYKVSNHHSSLVDWSFASLYSSSYVDSGFLAAFGWDENQDTGKFERRFKKIITDSRIFEKTGFSWGSQEKIYLANCNTIEVVRYVQSGVDSENEDSAFQHLESIGFDSMHGSIISGGIAYFGIIIEYEDALSVLCSDDTLITFPEAVARWKVYPRSKRYENHLHIIYEDRFVVYSFNHDYFVDQADKLKGIQYREKPPQANTTPQRTERKTV